jgi:outer membrane cobalamin receptor
MRFTLLVATFVCIRCWAMAQPTSPALTDTLHKQLKLPELVVSATRSERPVSELTVPVSVVTAKQIQLMGSFRLNDVLGEQTGLVITSDHGKGVQLQGFGADYTLILVDGEPLVGRTAGTLELSRLTVGNIQRIEIMKGPSSALYGSEALAGVINIITEKPREGLAASLRTRYGSNQTADLQADLNIKRGKWGLYGFANRYSTEGYSLGNESAGPTVAPFHNYTFNAKTTYQLNSRAELSVSGRYFTESQRSQFMIVENGVVQGIREAGQPGCITRLTKSNRTSTTSWMAVRTTKASSGSRSPGRKSWPNISCMPAIASPSAVDTLANRWTPRGLRKRSIFPPLTPLHSTNGSQAAD